MFLCFSQEEKSVVDSDWSLIALINPFQRLYVAWRENKAKGGLDGEPEVPNMWHQSLLLLFTLALSMVTGTFRFSSNLSYWLYKILGSVKTQANKHHNPFHPVYNLDGNNLNLCHRHHLPVWKSLKWWMLVRGPMQVRLSGPKDEDQRTLCWGPGGSDGVVLPEM